MANDANRLQFIAIVESDVGAKNVLVRKDDLAKLPRGRTRVVLQRHQNHPLAGSPGSGRNIPTTFESPSRTFDLQ